MSAVAQATDSSSTTPTSSSNSTSNPQDNTPGPSSSSGAGPPPKPAYGSGEADDGYTLVFANLDEFQAWRAREEEEKIVEFVKGDTHGSKAVPPRFKDHTKLVCARHTRSGRKKYVKKFPDRQRKLPSRKIEGDGCPASISYKTFFHTDQVRACYNDKHSHEIGEANLLFTRRGRKAAQDRNKNGTFRSTSVSGSPASSSLHTPNGITAHQSPDAIAAPSSVPHDPNIAPDLQHTHHSRVGVPHHSYPSAISLLAPLPPPPPAASQPADVSQERWDRMAVLFGSIRQHAARFEYPGPSVAALESVLIRLYLESPLGGSLNPSGISNTNG
ncbi:hypothetical protein BU17DRAFT_76596 [Hysterangium stoloniferum]|nr:hypothetical protein BU17DRAFT_76596 [Hysterangium stoloniferum]